MFTDTIKCNKATNRAAVEAVNLLESLITAFVLALIIVVFVVQPYIIPTGSMADTLRGAHFRLRCSQCGYRYDYNFEPQKYNLPENVIPLNKKLPGTTRCPSCGYFEQSDSGAEVTKGDKILAVKCLYQFFQPRRWDVVIFKNPTNPSITYIKRLIGRCGETVEIIDGDIYIDGNIARKPRKVQDELWMPIYDNDYQPVKPSKGIFNGHFWQQPFDVANSKWQINKQNQTEFLLDCDASQTSWLNYDTSIGNNFRATYAYDDIRFYNFWPFCSDLMVRFYVKSDTTESKIGAGLSKYDTFYKGVVDLNGEMVISKIISNKEKVLARKTIQPVKSNNSTCLEFANVDHMLTLSFGNERLSYDMGTLLKDAGPRKDIEPQAKILGSGKLTISHVAIFRDIHYTSSLVGLSEKGIATEGNPLTLGNDEYFVLGDNSPGSFDGRWWDKEGLGNGKFYRKGIVPKDYMIGKALVVFWPGGYKPFENFIFHIVPDMSKMKIIYGGSEKKSD